MDLEDKALCVDCRDVLAYDPQLYRYLIDHPREIIPLLDPIAYDIAQKIVKSQNLEKVVEDIQARICGCVHQTVPRKKQQLLPMPSLRATGGTYTAQT